MRQLTQDELVSLEEDDETDPTSFSWQVARWTKIVLGIFIGTG